MIKAVIFDMDGLLIDSEKSFLSIYQEMIDAKGNKVTFSLHPVRTIMGEVLYSYKMYD